VRDSGLLHALLGLENDESLLGHPVAGASWEGFVIENLIAAAGPHTTPYFYRSIGGAEVDLLLRLPDDKLWAIEVKRSLSPKVARGFHAACDDLQPARKLVVYAGDESFVLADDVQAISLGALCEALGNHGTQP